jgi:hypothetical protein
MFSNKDVQHSIGYNEGALESPAYSRQMTAQIMQQV